MMTAIAATAFTGCGKKENSVKNQLSAPTSGDKVATIKVKDFGDIKVLLFPKDAPKGVENFIGLAEKGYYNGVKFHRVVSDFMAQTGDPTGTGMGGESIFGQDFGVEYSKNLTHYTGALSYANTGRPNSNSSQFFIVSAAPISEKNFKQMASRNPSVAYTDEMKKNYEKIGGTPFLDGDYTVFGQVYEGMDVLNKIMAVDKKMNDMGELAVPTNDVVIETITIETVK